MRYFFSLLLFLTVYCVGEAAANGTSPNYTFKHIGLSDGLPESYIGSVFRLPDGRMAMRATDLIIWDGARFKRFPMTDVEYYPLAHGPINFNQYIDSSNRLWIKKRGELRVFDSNKERYIENVDSLLKLMDVNVRVSEMFIDSQDTFWFSAENGVLNYDLSRGLRTVIRKTDSEYPGDLVAVERTADGRYAWLVFSSGDVIRWDYRNNGIADRYDFLRDKVKLGYQVIVKPLADGRIAILTDGEVGVFDEEKEVYTPLLAVNTQPGQQYTSLEIDSKGNMWVSRAKHGVFVISPGSGDVRHIERFSLLSGEETASDVEHIFADTVSGGVWFALHDNGLLYYNEDKSGTSYCDISGRGGFKPDEDIITFIRLSGGNLIIGTGKGLYSMSADDMTPEQIYPSLSGKICRALFEDRNHRIWVGTFGDGLYCIEDGKCRRVFYSSTDYHDNVDYNNIRTIAQDHAGNMWIGVYGSVGRIDPLSGVFPPMTDSDKVFREFGLVSDIIFDRNGRLIAPCEKGTFIYDPSTGLTERLFDIEPSESGTVNPGRQRANSAAFDSEGNLWLGTHTGIYVSGKDGQVLRYGLESGFTYPVHSIYVDKWGRVWVLTSTNIYRAELVPENESSSNSKIALTSYIGEKSILRGDQLSFSVVTDGTKVLTPGRKGIVTINPGADSLSRSKEHLQSPFFNYLHVSEQETGIGQAFNGRVLYDYVLGENPVIELNYDESNVSIGFVDLDFNNLNSATYRYKLEGADKDWSEMTYNSPQGQVNYNNLNPGTYRLRVSTVGDSDVVGPESVFTIVIRPPWWLSSPFKVVWIILLLTIAGVTVMWIRQRNMRKVRMVMAAQEEERRKELEDLKIRFFTNISHELRTPLTLIITPLQSIIEKMPQTSPLLPKLSNIHQNARNLLMQINQLLDFRKLEVGADKFDPKPCNIVDLTRVAAGTFMAAATERNIDFMLHLPKERIIVNADKSKLSRVLTNLLSNAVKYTPQGGKIEVTLRVDSVDRTVSVAVRDNGIGIPDKEKDRIFERFFRASNAGAQTNSSSGIGLHLVKEYMEMHGGEATVVSREGVGSVFTVTIPLYDSEKKPVAVSEPETGDERPLILLAEDNDEFRSFMLGELSEHYRVVGVADGKQALEQAKEINPSIIVSDVMMPEMDGIELTKEIKSTIETSHIPVVLLTAHANETNEADGYEAGADAYISKPFNMHVLLTRIANLIEQQHGRWEKFEKHLEINPSEISITSPDEELIEKALRCVEEHIDDSDFSVDDLSDALAMSKATMYRKLQAITGQTPNNFIRTIRLKRGAQLLRTSSLSISEIAYRTGFSTPRYFSRLFKEEFGVLPTEYRTAPE